MVEARPCTLAPRTLAAVCAIVLAGGPIHAQSCLNGDSDLDTDVDLVDVASILRCYAPNGDPIPADCLGFDFGGDDSVGLDDFAAVAGALTGPLAGLPRVILDPPVTPTSALTVALSGEASRSCEVRIAGGGTTIIAPVVDGCFDVDYDLTANRINHIFITGLTADGTPGAPATTLSPVLSSRPIEPSPRPDPRR